MAPSEADSISRLYESYKASTNCFLKWLWCQQRIHSPCGTAVTFKSTKDILESALLLQMKKTLVPSPVIGSLRDAIAKRKKVCKIYEKLGLGDSNHVAFFQRLEKTLSVLTPLTSKSKTLSSDDAVDSVLKNPNPFSSLSVTVETVEDETMIKEAVVDDDHSSSGSASDDIDEASSEPPRDFVLEDDEVRDYFDSVYFLIELAKVHHLLDVYWAEAVREEIPLHLAAWLTSMAAYRITDMTPKTFFSVCSNLFTKCTCPECPGIGAFVAKITDTDDPEEPVRIGDKIYMLANAINEYGSSLGKLVVPAGEGRIRGCPDHHRCKCKFRTDATRDLLPGKTGSPLAAEERRDLEEILDIAKKGLLGKRSIARVERLKGRHELDSTNISEAFFDFAQILFVHKDHIAPGGLVFSAELFFRANEKALMGDARLNGSKCRLQCLRFAQEIRTDVLAVIQFVNEVDHTDLRWEDRTPYLQEFCDGLDEYLSERSFDIYQTSPWTVGNHMTELLTQAAEAGHNICWDWAVITSTLHLYNALRRSNFGIPQIPLFEQLAHILIHDSFMGALPERHFVSLYRRVVYDCKIAKAPTTGKSRLEVGFTKSSPVRGHIVSWFVEQHCAAHDQDMDWLEVVHGVATYTRRPCTCCKDYHRKDVKIRDIHDNVKLSELLKKAKETVLPELVGQYPISHLNFFKLFMFCGKILETLTNRTFAKLLQSKKVDGTSFHALEASRAVAELELEDIDEHGDRGRQGRRFFQRSFMHSAVMQTFQEVDREASLDQFLWNI